MSEDAEIARLRAALSGCVEFEEWARKIGGVTPKNLIGVWDRARAALSQPKELRPERAARITIDPDGSLAEVVTAGGQIEKMGWGEWFIGLYNADGSSVVVWLLSKSRISACLEERSAPTKAIDMGKHEPLGPEFEAVYDANVRKLYEP